MATKSTGETGVGVMLMVVAFVLVPFAAWLQHLYTCFTEDRWGILIAGALFFPIGIIHGIGIWFGFWH
jgi:hypothetical protein